MCLCPGGFHAEYADLLNLSRVASRPCVFGMNIVRYPSRIVWMTWTPLLDTYYAEGVLIVESMVNKRQAVETREVLGTAISFAFRVVRIFDSLGSWRDIIAKPSGDVLMFITSFSCAMLRVWRCSRRVITTQRFLCGILKG